LPMEWNLDTATHIPLHWDKSVQNGGNAVNSFRDCYTMTLADWFKDNKPDDAKIIDAAVKFGGAIEKNMECSGACTLPLFGITRVIAEGPPTDECVSVLLDALGSLLIVGIVCFITFIVLFLAVCGAIPLCTGFNNP
jgi:hypothetical protein